MEDKIQTTVKDGLVRQTLIRGTWLSACGALLLLVAGTSMQPSLLSHYGWMLFLIAIGCITCGLLPYSRLRRLEVNPYQIRVEQENFVLFRNHKPLMAIPLKNILGIDDTKFKQLYGITCILKTPLSQRMFLLNRLGFFPHYYITKEGNIFFPYFNQRAYSIAVSLFNASAEVI